LRVLKNHSLSGFVSETWNKAPEIQSSAAAVDSGK